MPVLNLLTINQALSLGANEIPLSDTAKLDSELILLHVLEAHRNILFTDPDQLLTPTQQKYFVELIARRKTGEPVAYIIGTQGFWDLTLKVAPSTLIPRPDTESLVEWVLDRQLQPKRILDLGTGTGALALALASEFPQANVIGVDLLEDAVVLANENKLLNKLSNVSFQQSSWFDSIAAQEPFDLIVSNPPYIDRDDRHLAEGDVRFEPASALIADQKGLADLYLIAQQAKSFLSPEGILLMEHGWQQADLVQKHLQSLAYREVDSGLDLGGNLRFTYGINTSK